MDKSDITKHLKTIHGRIKLIYQRPHHAYMVPRYIIHQFLTNKSYLALALAFFFTSFSTGNSLFLSEILGLPVCELCWFQRILMYPLSLLTGIALLRRDTEIAIYVFPLALLGAFISTYHSYIQRFGRIFAKHHGCSPTGPDCVQIVRTALGLSIPNWALVGFIGTLAATSYILYNE